MASLVPCRGLAAPAILALMLAAVLIMLAFQEGKFAARFIAGAMASPLSGTKIKQPWVNPSKYWELLAEPARRFIPTYYDVRGDERLRKLLNVGACSQSGAEINDLPYVPPLDGTPTNNMFCQDAYGMRFVLFDLQLVNVDSVDVLSGSFTAQFQLAFHWMERWEVNETVPSWSAYSGDPITTSENANMCGFTCDSTSATKSMCCDRMWVPSFQLPSCKLNSIDSVMEAPSLLTRYSNYSYDYKSLWGSQFHGGQDYVRYDTRRVWYVGIDVTCPFTPDFHNFPFDYQFLTLDIVNPYASHTWLQLNKGFLQANIINSIGDIDLNSDWAIDGWRMKDVIVSSACGTQQTWAPTLLTQDDLLRFLGDGYESQRDQIGKALSVKNLSCAGMEDLSVDKDSSSLGNPANYEPYQRTRDGYLERVNATIAEYKECTRRYMVGFKWNHSLPSNLSELPLEKRTFNYTDAATMNRSFSFLDFQYLQAPSDGVNFKCLIDAIANLTTPGIRVNIIIQRYKLYYLVKLVLPTFACVAFSFAAFSLGANELLGRLTVVVPAAIALSALQGYVVASDVPAVAYMAPTTYIVVLSYVVQLLITLESSILKFWIIIKTNKSARRSGATKPLPSLNNHNDQQDACLGPNILDQDIEMVSTIKKPPLNQETQQLRQTNSYTRIEKAAQEEVEQQQFSCLRSAIDQLQVERKVDVIFGILLGMIYIISIILLICIPWRDAKKFKERNLQFAYVTLLR